MLSLIVTPRHVMTCWELQGERNHASYGSLLLLIHMQLAKDLLGMWSALRMRESPCISPYADTQGNFSVENMIFPAIFCAAGSE